MVESSPALAPILVQDKSMANDGGALGGKKQRGSKKVLIVIRNTIAQNITAQNCHSDRVSG